MVFSFCESEKWHLIVTYLDRNEADRLQSGAYVQITSCHIDFNQTHLHYNKPFCKFLL